MGITQEAEDAFEALSEVAFASHCFGDLACRSQITAPSEAENKGKRDQSEEFFELGRVCHVGIFEIEPSLFEMTEKLFDSPAQLVKFKSFGSVKAVTNKMEAVVATSLRGDCFRDKE